MREAAEWVNKASLFMSDVTFVVKEAGRRAVKSKEDMITNELIFAAIDSLPKEKGNSRKIGF